MPNTNARRARRTNVAALLAVIALVGCSGSGASCGTSCGGAFKTVDNQGHPLAFSGDKLPNVASVRITKSGFSFLNATHLNDLLANLNGGAALSAVSIPCTEQNIGLNLCIGSFGTEFSSVFIGDTNFNNSCGAGEGPKAHVSFKDVTWGLDSANQILKAKLTAHIFTDPIFIHTKEAHSSLCGSSNGISPVQARIYYNDEPADPLAQRDTVLDLDIKFTPSPDGRLELNVTDASLNALINRFDAGFIQIDGFSGPPGTVPAKGTFSHDACGSSGGTYNVEESPGNLNCGGVLRIINANCDPLDPDPKGLCLVFQAARDYLLNTLKNQFAPQIVSLLRTQIDKVRCQRSADSAGVAHDCDSTHSCPNDDSGTPLTCDTARGVCVPQGQSPLNPGVNGGTVNGAAVGEHNCEPVPLGITGQLDVATLTDKVGFPAGAGLLATLGLGSKTASPAVDGNGVQLAAMAGTAPPEHGFVSLCVPPATAKVQTTPPALNFDDSNNKPSTVGTYDVGISVASQMMNRAMFDAYTAGLLCTTLDNKTTSFISSGLFKTFLPSLGLVTGGKDVGMSILLRPTQPPTIRIGKGTLKTNPDGTFSPDDALITVNFKAMNLEFYGLVDERQVRLFTLQADLALPLGLRTGTGASADQLTPVLGGLDTVLSNIKALNNEMLAEDPGVVRDLLGAAVRLAQPLLAGLLQPVTLPNVLGLKLSVGGIVGAVPISNDLATDGYQHLAIYAGISECTNNVCPTFNVTTEARISAVTVPADADEVRAGQNLPSVEIEAAALNTRHGRGGEFSYRVDGGLWSPWVQGPRFRINDRILLFQGRHTVEVTSREAGDDRTQDVQPVRLETFISYESPKAELVARADGSVVTKAHSPAAAADKLLYSYRVGDAGGWTTPGPARVFTAAELNGASLHVTVSDESGKAAVAKFGTGGASDLQLASMGSCATSSGATNPSVLALLALAAVLFRRRGSRKQ